MAYHSFTDTDLLVQFNFPNCIGILVFVHRQTEIRTQLFLRQSTIGTKIQDLNFPFHRDPHVQVWFQCILFLVIVNVKLKKPISHHKTRTCCSPSDFSGADLVS